MKPGIYDNISIQDYHSNRMIISSTALKEAKKSSRHLAYYICSEPETKQCFDFGNAFELALIDAINKTEYFNKEVIVLDPENRPEQEKGITSRVNQEWKNSLHEKGYVIPKSGPESEEVLNAMVRSVMAEPLLVRLLTLVDYQKSFVWRDESGVLCKTRPDIVKNKKGVLIDIKTTKDASPGGFQREANKYEYFLQAAMQIEGVLQTGYMEKVDSYYWLAVEKSAPYNAVLYEFSLESRKESTEHYDYYIKRCAKVIQDLNDFGGYYELIHGYSENADNKFGILELEIPLYYQR